MVVTHSAYRGRFAPSPTGPLHFGSLYTAVASYLHARSEGGQWLVRIDDLDPYRCKQEYASKILDTLVQFGLTWDEDILYQSHRIDAYKSALSRLQRLELLYPCHCSRKNLMSRQGQPGPYDGFCLAHPPKDGQPAALRIKLPNKYIFLNDDVQGPSQLALKKEIGDFVIFRKDDVVSYHLAVVIDDDEQGITHVLRGSDLLDSTYQQIHLQQLLHLKHPGYAHIPVISDTKGHKLSKQTNAHDISLAPVNETLINILRYLNLNPPPKLLTAKSTDILEWGIHAWSLKRIQPKDSIIFQTD